MTACKNIAIVCYFGMWLLACRVNVDYGNTALACADGECPSDYSCVEKVCVLDDAADNDSADAAPPVETSDGSIEEPLPEDAQPAASTCDDDFSAAPGYELCSEDAESCSFNVNTAGGTCAEACLALGSTCVAAIDNNDPCDAQPETGDTCETPRNSEICVCSRVTL